MRLLTRTDAAHLLGITVDLFRLFEREGKIPPPRLDMICQTTGVCCAVWTTSELRSSDAARWAGRMRREQWEAARRGSNA